MTLPRSIAQIVVLLTTAALVACGSSSTVAKSGNSQDYVKQAGKSVVFAGPGGGLGDDLKVLFAEFTKQTGITVVYLPGPISDLFGRMQAEKTRPTIDVYWSNGPTESKGIANGMYSKLDPKIVSNLGEVYDLAKVPNNYGVRVEFTDIGLLYNQKAYKDHNIPAPTKWADVWNPAISGRVILGDTTSFFTVLYIAYMNHLLGGDESNPDKGIAYIAKQKSKLLAVVRTYPERTQLLSSGAAWLTVDSGITSIPVAMKDSNLAYVSPKEGSPLFWNSVHVVKGDPNPIGAQLLINFMISQQFQDKLAHQDYVGPVNKNVKLQGAIAKLVPYGPQGIASFVPLNNGKIGDALPKYRDEWETLIATK